MIPRDLTERFGSPLWIVDLDAARAALDGLSEAFRAHWPETTVAYSYKTNRLVALLAVMAEDGAGADVVCEAEYLLAREVIGLDGANIIVNGPAKSARLLDMAGDDGALVVVDTADELDRAAAAGVERVGLRVALPGAGGAVSRFGMPEAELAGACDRARSLGMHVECLSTHLVSTDFIAGSVDTQLAQSVAVLWPRPSDDHVAAARLLGRWAVELGIETVNLGGGHPPEPESREHARQIADALHAAGFDGRLVVEPGRAIIAGAVDLIATVVSRKTLGDGRTCVVLDAGTNLLPATLWSWPTLDGIPARPSAQAETVLVSGPLCLNTDVLHPDAEMPALWPGDHVIARSVGAYQQVHATQFGDPRPAVVAHDDGQWREVRRRETVEDLISGELLPRVAAHAVPNNDREVER